LYHDFTDFFRGAPRANGCEFPHAPTGENPLNRPFSAAATPLAMEAEAEAQFLDRIIRFSIVSRTLAPILEALRRGLATERAFLNAVISGFTGHSVVRICAGGGLAASSVSAAATDLCSAGSGEAAAPTAGAG
jgi:hypothetical protein